MFNKHIFKLLLQKAIGDNTITDFAKICNVNRTYLSKYINEKLDNAPSPEILRNIAKHAKEVTYKELMIAAGYLTPDDIIDDAVDNIKATLSSNPDLIDFWDKLTQRKDLHELFIETKEMNPAEIKQIIRIIKAMKKKEE